MEQSFRSLPIFVALGCQVETSPSHFGGRPAHEDIADVENHIPDHWFKPAFIGSLSRVAVGEYLKNRDRLALQGPKSRCPGWIVFRPRAASELGSFVPQQQQTCRDCIGKSGSCR